MTLRDEKKNKRVVPRWVVVFGIVVILGIVVYGLARIIIPMQRATGPFSAEQAPATDSGVGRPVGGLRGAGPLGFVRRLFGGGSGLEAVLETATVSLLDVERSVDGSGTLISIQSGDLSWETTGTVAKVLVQVGDSVRAGDVLLELDPLSAPQNVIVARADLISARQDLDELLNPTALQISQARQAVAGAQETLDDLRDPSALAVANAQQAVADAREVLEQLQDPTALDVANAQQAVADARDALRDLQNPSAAQIAAAEQGVASARDVLRDQQEALDELLDPDIDALQDAVRDAEFELAGAEKDIELTDIGSATSALENARDALETAEERRVSVQKALDACTVHKVEQENERDVHDYAQLSVSEEVVHGGFTYLEGSVYEVFEETAQTMLDTFGSIVTRQSYRVCDPDRGVSVDGVIRTLAEADEDVVAANDTVREAELQLESTRMGNTTALDVATEALQDTREALDDALAGVDPIDLAVAQAAVDDAAGELADAEEQLELLLEPQPEDVAVAAGNLADAEEQLELLLEPQPEDMAVAAGNLADTEEQLEQLLDPQPADVAVAEAELADELEQLQEFLNGPDPDDVAAAEAKVMAVQATLYSLRVVAPFDGQVLAVNYLVGDYTEQSTSAVKLANVEQLRVEVSVDETEVNGIRVGQPANLTFDAVSGVEVAGEVTHVAPYGETVQGLVRFPVTVTLKENGPEMLLGMTAYVRIVTEVMHDALAVPIDAVQYDDEGEYVMLSGGPGREQTRVAVVSGVIQDEMVVVSGELRAGQRVVIFTPQPTQSGSPFGPPGGGGR
ncbi:MAG TPA: efflux RND transporter periplasmic adaptor subunit [Anaerolineales bacterium]|nr:efflux RND transporter periplasmic adaptor subunit [Anaerolineales bacterium]